MKKINKYLSAKITCLATVSMIAVVFVHAYNYTDSFLQPTTLITEGLHLGACIEFLISNALARFAVPVFFAISGFLFFYGKDFCAAAYGRLLKKRVGSIVVVFLIFSAVSYAVCGLIYLATGDGLIYMIDERMVKVLEGGAGWLYPLLQNPFAFQLWFLPQLFIMAIVSPVVYILVKKLKWVPLLVLGGLWLADMGLSVAGYTVFNCDAYAFFTLGAYIAVNDIKLPGMKGRIGKSRVKAVAVALWLAVGIVYTLRAATISEATYLQTLLFKISVLAGVFTVWVCFETDGSGRNKKPLLEVLKRNNFMVFLLHEPVMHLVFLSTLHYFDYDVLHMLLYFPFPIALVLVCAFIGELLRRKTPRLSRVLTGGR